MRKLIAGPTVYICDECVDICLDIIAEERENDEQEGRMSLPKPEEIRNFLAEYVVGQEEAKKRLAVAVYNHYKRNEISSRRRSEIELAKSNILLIGPCSPPLSYSTFHACEEFHGPGYRCRRPDPGPRPAAGESRSASWAARTACPSPPRKESPHPCWPPAPRRRC